MISVVKLIQVFAAFALILSAGGCATVAAPEDLLRQAGFRTYVVRDNSQLAQVRVLPRGQISIVQRNRRSYWLYPSVALDEIYVGRRGDYAQYQRLLAQQLASNEKVQSNPLPTGEVVWTGGWSRWGPFFPLGEPPEY